MLESIRMCSGIFFFGVAVYDLWKDRNNLVFSRNSVLERELLFKTLAQVRFIQHATNKSRLNTVSVHRKEVYGKWEMPSPGWHKLNIDGSHSHMTGSSACGGWYGTRRDALFMVSSVRWGQQMLFGLNYGACGWGFNWLALCSLTVSSLRWTQRSQCIW